MREIEVLAANEQAALEAASKKLDIPLDKIEIVEEYEPDELDLESYQKEQGLDAPPSPDEVTLYLARVAFQYYVEKAEEWTRELIERFAPGSTASAMRHQHIIIVRLDVPESSILIGRKGATLDALQHVVVRALLTHDEKFPDVMLDVENYREKKLQRLEKEALRAADKAVRTGRRQPLSPMSPAERKFIHKILRDHGGVKTESRGQDLRRHIVIESLNATPRGGGGAGGRGGGGGGGRDGGRGGGRKGGQQEARKGNAYGIKQNGPITEEQRQLLYGREMARREMEEEEQQLGLDKEDLLDDEKRYLGEWEDEEGDDIEDEDEAAFDDKIE